VLALALTVGEYHVTLALHKGLSHQDGCFHWLEHAASFVVRATIWGDGYEPPAPAVADPDEPCQLHLRGFPSGF
jgi:hypothetical protein